MILSLFLCVVATRPSPMLLRGFHSRGVGAIRDALIKQTDSFGQPFVRRSSPTDTPLAHLIDGNQGNVKEPWHLFLQGQFNLGTNERLATLKQSLSGTSPADFNFFPLQPNPVVLDECLSFLRMHAKLFYAGTPKIDNFQYDLLRRKTWILMEKMRLAGYNLDPRLLPKNEIFEAYSISDLAAFFHGFEKQSILDERHFLFIPAINGIPFTVTYENGFIRTAYASECAEKQVDIIDLIRTLSDVPKVISEAGVVSFSGVLFIQTKDLYDLNLARKNHGLRNWADTRSAVASALLHSTEPNKVLELKLKCYFDSYHTDRPSQVFDTFADLLKSINKQGFPTMPPEYIMQGVWRETLRISHDLRNLPFESPGIIIKTDPPSARHVQNLNSCLFKFVPKLYETTVNRIDFQALPNGRIIAIIHVQPVQIGKKAVASFTINNETHFSELNIRPGSSVTISSFPNMMPQLLNPCRSELSRDNVMPTHCPKCQAALAKIVVSGGDVTACCSTHLSCVDDSVESIEHAVSSAGLHIPSLSNSFIQELVDRGMISSVSDIFLLSDSDDGVLKNISSDFFKQLLLEIQRANSTTLERFIYALNIPQVNSLMAEELAYMVGTIDRLKSISQAKLEASKYIDAIARKSILSFFSDPKKLGEIEKFLTNGVVISEPNQEIMDLCYQETSANNKDHYEKIVRKIQSCNREHSVTDFEFDLLNQTAEKIEERHPEWALSRVPAQTERPSIKLSDPITLKKTYSTEELKLLLKKIGSSEIVVEPKVNGIACSLRYVKGKLVAAFTKNNNSSAQDVTDSILNFISIPKMLNEDFTGTIRGELFISNDCFTKINAERERYGMPLYKDALGIMVGAIRKKENNLLIRSGVQFFGYHVTLPNDLCNTELNPIPSQEFLHNYLKKLGFLYDLGVPYAVFTDLSAAQKYMIDVESRRRECSSNIDGMVVKARNPKEQNLSIAYKFKLETLRARVADVEFYRSSDGRIKTRIVIEPITFSNGRTVSRISSDVQTVRGLRVQDLVNIQYSGGAVPIIESVIHGKNKGQGTVVEIPTNCPECEGALALKDCGVLQCTNLRCTGSKSSSVLLHFANTMNLSIGNGTIKTIIEAGRVSTISDFYRLLPEELSAIKTLSHEDTRRFFLDVEQAKAVPLDKLLYAFSIPGIGAISAQNIAEHFKTLEDLSKATVEDLQEKGITPSVAGAIVKYFKDNNTCIDYLVKIGIAQAASKHPKNKGISALSVRDQQRIFKIRQAEIDAAINTVIEITRKSTIANERDLITLKGTKPFGKSGLEWAQFRGKIAAAQRYNDRVLRSLVWFLNTPEKTPVQPQPKRTKTTVPPQPKRTKTTQNENNFFEFDDEDEDED